MDKTRKALKLVTWRDGKPVSSVPIAEYTWKPEGDRAMSFEHDPTPASEVFDLKPAPDFKALLLAYWATQDDTQEEDAFNTLTDAISEALTDEQRADWEDWNLKATQDEIVVGGLDRLGLQALQEQAWKEFRDASQAAAWTAYQEGKLVWRDGVLVPRLPA